MVLYGRDAELAAIDEALASARDGRGRAVFITGESGLGKSSLLAEARARAQRPVLDGAAWESPGAPPYWPWIQVLRAAEAQLGARVRAQPRIARLLGDADAVAHEEVDPAAARFALLDAVVRALIALAAEQPLLVVLDDLHAADLPSLELLDLACRELAGSSIAIVAAWRDGELATRPDAEKRLSRAGRHAVVCPLRRLSAAEVTRWVGSDGAALHAASEGNPLFIEELQRAKRTGAPPRGITSVLDDHLALVSAETRTLLRAASVLGRELVPAVVAAVSGRDADAVDRALREATAVGLGDPREQRWVFRHVLLRDQLYQELSASERTALHRAAGEELARRAPSSTDAAHHLIAGIGDGEVTHPVAVAREAAARAMQLHAFEDAGALLSAAVRALEGANAEIGLRIDVRLELARARQGTGATETMMTEALRAAELAKQAGDAERFALAALAYSAELVSGRRDPVMIDLLETASAGLPPGDSKARARVMGRLAAALVPVPFDFLMPFQLADRAVEMAERLDDDDTRMFTMRWHSHAHGFRLGIAEALPNVRRVVELADRLGRPMEAVEHRSWMINAHLAVGDLGGADMWTEPFAALLARHPQPQYQWRMPLVRATRAVLRGDLEEADRLHSSVRILARDHDLERARMCWMFGAVGSALVARSAERAALIVDDLRALANSIGGAIGNALLACMLAVLGRHDEARRELAVIPVIPAIGLSEFILDAALIVDDRTVIAAAIEPLREVIVKAPLAYGPSMSFVLPPIETVLGEALVRLDRASEAVAPAERGLDLARKLQAPLFVARGATALASALAATGGPRDRIAALHDEARRVSPSAAPVTAVFAPAITPGLGITRAGDQIAIAWRGRELRVSPSKGLDYLAALVARPGGEIHVSELVGDEDRGDAGEVLDATARGAYKARVEELREALDDAQQRNDLGRLDRLTAELDLITEQLVASTGLGGRSRRAGSRVERARVNVQRRIRDAIQRLAIEDPTLARHLDATIRTGTFCSFTPLDG